MREELQTGVEEHGYRVGVQANPKRADVQLVQLRDSLQKLFGARPQSCVVPEALVPMRQLEMVHILKSLYRKYVLFYFYVLLLTDNGSNLTAICKNLKKVQTQFGCTNALCLKCSAVQDCDTIV